MPRTIMVLLHFAIFFSGSPLRAEVIRDGSVGPTDQLDLSGPDYKIDAELGQQDGGNLFHSFQTFNIDLFERATFSGPDSVENVISRVTGGNPSDINGMIRCTIPEADFYLLNPAGILFGQNARLDVKGSFHASTADTLYFKDGTRFSASLPETSSVLITAAPEAFGFLQGNTPAKMSFQDTYLETPEGKTLSLAGGDLDINNSELSAPSGLLKLVSLASPAKVRLDETGSVEGGAQGGKITAIAADMNTGDPGTGRIFIHAGNFELEQSKVRVTRGRNDKKPDADVTIDIQAENISLEDSEIITRDSGPAGEGANLNIRVNATGALNIQAIAAFTGIESATSGRHKAGNAEVSARDIQLQNGAKIRSITYGQGDVGDVTVKAADTLHISGIDEYSSIPLPDSSSGIHVSSTFMGSGSPGAISVEAGSLKLDKGGQIHTSTLEAGDAGNIHLTVRNTLEATGKASRDGIDYFSGILADAGSATWRVHDTGDAGNIDINAGNILIQQGARISGATHGTGTGGAILINTPGILAVSGMSEDGGARSNISADTKGDGAAGSVLIRASQMVLADGGGVTSSTSSNGQGGDISIAASRLSLTNPGTVIDTRAAGAGDGGSVRIDVNGAMTLSGSAQITGGSQSLGDAGDIVVTARDIRLTGGAGINNSSRGIGQGGQISLKADKLTLENPGTLIDSSTSGPGQGGSIDIEVTDTMRLDHAAIAGVAHGAGNAGSMRIQAPRIAIVGGVIASGADGSGQGGQLFFEADDMTLNDNARIDSSTDGPGSGGAIDIQTRNGLALSNNSNISADASDTGRGGEIDIVAPRVTLNGNARINSNTSGSGSGGEILIRADDTLALSGSDISADTHNTGRGGMIDIVAPRVILNENAHINSNTSGPGSGGEILIRADTLALSGSDISVDSRGRGIIAGKGGTIDIAVPQITLNNAARIAGATSGTAQGGDINLFTNDLSLADTARIDSSTRGSGKGGSVFIKTEEGILTVSGGEISAKSQSRETAGEGGDIRIEAPRLALIDGARINNGSEGSGDGGNTRITVKETVSVSGESAAGVPSGIFSVSESEAGDGGDAGEIKINAGELILQDGTVISASTLGGGQGGNLTIRANGPINIRGADRDNNGSVIEADTRGAGQGGTLVLAAGDLSLSDGGKISASAHGGGKGGDVTLILQGGDTALGTLFLSAGGNLALTSTGSGDAGNLQINADGLIRLENAFITAQSAQAGGGEIKIETPARIYLLNANIITSAGRDGGNISISNREFMILDKSLILANAVHGKGGDITINSLQLVQSGDSIVDASSTFAMKGGVKVSSPDEDAVTGLLVALPVDLLTKTELAENRCAMPHRESPSSFVRLGRDTPPAAPDDLQTHSILFNTRR
ncbi:MAG: filamentous hemagglutinin N-terminal domain-containing protein [Gammaproteobacteria bacterium]|nr:filamentous hemagglutinin N-terminal domain-containing protein [Gammaproteobacteria bacterium]